MYVLQGDGEEGDRWLCNKAVSAIDPMPSLVCHETMTIPTTYDDTGESDAEGLGPRLAAQVNNDNDESWLV